MREKIFTNSLGLLLVKKDTLALFAPLNLKTHTIPACLMFENTNTVCKKDKKYSHFWYNNFLFWGTADCFICFIHRYIFHATYYL